MLPSILSQQVKKGLEDYLRSTYPIDTPSFKEGFDKLFASDSGFIKGPYFSLELPFKQESSSYTSFFDGSPLPHKPYCHQRQAFDRLKSPQPQSTLIATGTGSGKTECFLLPILDHCYRNKAKKGIKAIIIYPMNALASDQGRRLAQLIDSQPLLKNNIRAGLYIGEQGKNSQQVMRPDKVITDREMLRSNPPDILLTNYKMLDYLLIRPGDHPLWRHNGPDTLQYLVVDELHTFDGAQGTDLACLIRRLKARLQMEDDKVCCIGTSATLGGQSSPEKLSGYAQKVFNTPFSSEALITEKRLSPEEFLLAQSIPLEIEALSPHYEKNGNLDSLKLEEHQSYEAFIAKQLSFWFGNEIGARLKADQKDKIGIYLAHLPIFQNLMRVLEGQTLTSAKVLEKMSAYDKALARYPNDQKELLLNSLLSLISEARNPGNKALPFLKVKVQFWIRELAKIVSPLDKKGLFLFAHDLPVKSEKRHFPIINCRDCGTTGWLASKGDECRLRDTELENIYSEFFDGQGDKLLYVFPKESQVDDKQDAHNLCTECFTYTKEGKCPRGCDCGSLLSVSLFSGAENKGGERSNRCFFCGSSNGLAIVGSRVASLASVIIGQLFTSYYNRDKKVLAFSDSVQDAAHRSSFFGARTYRFTMRTAIQQSLEALPNPISLKSFHESFMEYWNRRANINEFVAKFVAPNMLHDEEFRALCNNKRITRNSKLYKDIEKRIEWEILSEYGLFSSIGRTLESAGASTAQPSKECIDKITDFLHPRLVNQQGSFIELQKKELSLFLQGMIMHLKRKGAFLHPILESYIEEGGNSYLLNRISWMPNFGNRRPTFLTMDKDVLFFDSLLPKKTATAMTWFQNWAGKALGWGKDSEWRPFFRLLIDALVDFNLLEERKTKKGVAVWGVSPDALQICKETAQLKCGSCSHKVITSIENADAWEEGPCLRFQCKGCYKLSPNTDVYYKNRYREGALERIFSGEHTSLLSRKEREKVELEFKASETERKPWYTNVLSCTPTLEMGVDIGDLSAVILCSMPPSQASFIQRVGRSGRKNGNAFNVVIANAKPHDLYFFTEPDEMLSGKIDPPDVYLNAQAVLQRQLLAYCMDCWAAAEKAVMPRKVADILNRLESQDPEAFPYNLFEFIDQTKESLWAGFSSLFSKNLEEHTKNNLRNYFEKELSDKLLEELQQLQGQVASIEKSIRSLARKKEQIEKQSVRTKADDDQIKEINEERSGLLQLKKSLTSSRDPYHFLTDAGLLPNYAFPEAGVKLNTVILKEKLTQEETYPPAIKFTYERPSYAAIAEMAPNNTFYAQGRKVVIDQVDLNLSSVERWRFCNQCSHMELNDTCTSMNCCPNCNSELWSDQGQVKQLIRLKSVIATNRDKDTRLEDNQEERTKKSFLRKMHVTFKRHHIEQSYKIKLDNKTFAFEFLPSASFCEVNFGERGPDQSPIEIAGEKKPRKGFQICSKCGKVQSGREPPRHTNICPEKKKSPQVSQFIDSIWLYRQFDSECIKLLIPPYSGSDLERGEASFVAAFHLGLKKKFGGSIDHLQVTFYEEPIRNGLSSKYLILYDSVPGGTGYLKELTRSPENLIDVLQYAYNTLRTCACNIDSTKDGCYQCLYSYRCSRELKEVSRELAKKMLADIIKNKENIEKISNIGELDLENEQELSELERRFLQTLDRYKKQGANISTRRSPVNNKPGMRLQIEKNVWQLESDVYEEIPNGDGVQLQIDFVIRPIKINGSTELAQNSRPVAIFTDGFKYHKNQIFSDMSKRMALVKSGKYVIWSLTWNDIVHCDKKMDSDHFINLLSPSIAPHGGLYKKGMEKIPPLFSGFYNLNSFALLIEFLSHPILEDWKNFSSIHSALFLYPREECWERIDSLMKEIPNHTIEHMHSGKRIGSYTYRDSHNADALKLFFSISNDNRSCNVTCCLDDSDNEKPFDQMQLIWNEFLRLYNLSQFLPEAIFITRKGIESGYYTAPVVVPSEFDESEKDEFFKTGCGIENKFLMEAIEECVDAEAKQLLLSLSKFPDCLIPTVGYELVESGKIIGTGELCWPDSKIAFVPPGDEENLNAFQSRGWLCLSIDQMRYRPEEIVALTEKREIHESPT